MNNTQDAMKMMTDGFTLVAKGFAEMVKRMNETAAATAVAKTSTGSGETRTVTLPEAAKRLGLSRTTIDRLCAAGELLVTVDPRNGWRRVVEASLSDYFHRHLKKVA